MKRKLSRRMKRNLGFLFILFALMNLGLIGRVIYIKHFKGENYERQVFAQQVSYNHILPYKRGDILDRNGTKLATSVKEYNLILDPEVIAVSSEQAQLDTIEVLNQIYGIDKELIEGYIESPNGSYYVPLKKNLTYPEIEPLLEVMEGKVTEVNSEGQAVTKIIKGVWLEEKFVRTYPFDNLASHVLGFSLEDNVGRWGLEEYYNDYLSGEIGREFGVLSDGLYVKTETKSPKNGNTLITTIDQTIQYYTEQALSNFSNTYDSLNATAIVMNPNNGEVLALANSGSFNLNAPYDLSQFFTEEEQEALSNEERINFLNQLWRNNALSDTYEPGSTFKPMTIAAALEEGVLTGDETFYCPGYKIVYDYNISCWEEEGHGEQTLSEALGNSCNVALMEIAELMGKEIFADYQVRFGFGEKTNIDVYGESSAANLLYSADAMGPVELATNSFGQSFNVTPLQLITAFSSIINGGNLYEPQFVKQIVDESGRKVASFDEQLARKVISKETSDIVKGYLYDVVLDGTGAKAHIEGYDIGGKTGTAEKLPRGNEKYVVSFIGFTPIEKPEVIVLVVIDEPVANNVDSKLAGDVFKEIMTNILPYLNIYPSTN